jgi:DNA-directed RNA polymerase specialized sigma24 family protein
MPGEETMTDSFTSFVEDTEPRLKRALVAAFGREVGVEATADALMYGWEHWDRMRRMRNPAGYLWTVGRNRARRLASRSPRLFASVRFDRLPWVDPELAPALERLSEKQRVSVLLVHGYGWTLAEVADLLGVSVSTVQQHTERAMSRLRRSLRIEQ